MKLSTIANVAGALNAARIYHVSQRSYFSRLFQQEFKLPADLADTPAVNNPLAEFYQSMSEHHAAEVFRVDIALQKYQDLCDAEMLRA